MSSKEDILSRIREAKKIEGLVVEPTPDPVKFIKNANENNDLLSEFKTRVAENRAFVIECDRSEIEEKINEIIKKEEVKNLLYPVNLPIDVEKVDISTKFAFDNEIENFKERLFEYDFSIIQARMGVSSHGVFCVASSKEQPRLLSLTPKVCVVLLKKENMTKSMSGALNQIKEEDGRFPTNIIFISGPSRTADIELITVLGVHGSQIVYVILY
ncbi:LutC/YkgG family protein [Campylobacter geochelonis]|uniref:LutC/YkgG family protein n=1 Tax=Campylobacter geochelonis TaxID=1780362 RepID=UPI000770B841|nr:lactate utilization protein C [Campylobacter geochelonis]CZE51478.1 Uncharacterised ACR%2C YkgG family COG1556 [Campylobacter geochelonis]